MIDDVHRAAPTLSANPDEPAREHAEAIAQETAISWVVNVALDTRGIHAQLPPARHPAFARHAHDPLMNRVGDGGTQQRKHAAEGTEIGRHVRLEAREAPVDQIAPQLAFQLPETPALQVLEHTAGYLSAYGRRPARHVRTSCTSSASANSASTGSRRSSLSRDTCWAIGWKNNHEWRVVNPIKSY